MDGGRRGGREASQQSQRLIELSARCAVEIHLSEQAAIDVQIDDLEAHLIDPAADRHQLSQDVVALPALFKHALNAPDLPFDAP